MLGSKVAVVHGTERSGRLHVRVLLQIQGSGFWLVSLCHSALPSERCPTQCCNFPSLCFAYSASVARYLLSGAADASVAIFDTQQDPWNALQEDEGVQQRVRWGWSAGHMQRAAGNEGARLGARQGEQRQDGQEMKKCYAPSCPHPNVRSCFSLHALGCDSSGCIRARAAATAAAGAHPPQWPPFPGVLRMLVPGGHRALRHGWVTHSE